jgi:hypothetical protein
MVKDGTAHFYIMDEAKRVAMTFERVEIEVARVTRALERGEHDKARAMAADFMNRIGAQAAQYPAAVAWMKVVAAGAREVPSSN